MVRVLGSVSEVDGNQVSLDDYWIDRYEVTNRQFKTFVDRGGYRSAQYWKVPFVGKTGPLSWAEAMARFGDATKRPGPATWELGSYAEGEDDLPVTGVSWYEAAAYAAFAGKDLPTVFHWRSAGGFQRTADTPRRSCSRATSAARNRREGQYCDRPPAPATWPAM
jgi:formylglycine-generating enzyme required for sulfatase activity